MPAIDISERLRRHLGSWVGEWPPPPSGVRVVAHDARLRPTWDGTVRPLLGVGDGSGVVLSVRPDAADAVRDAVAAGLDDPGLGLRLGEILGVGPARFGSGVFRASGDIDPTIDALGEWAATQRSDLPEWLAPFNGPRLVVRDGGHIVAGVGIKIHDEFGHELSVVTDEAARGRGFARRLVATAARQVLADGRVPVYLHERSNAASAHVADAVGFRDEGWSVFGLWPSG
jgi:GNAT superfamily N-acetyltransferase